ncbi:MAG: transposase [Salinicola sp.]|nr:transposase [Salinicola sp.]|tara:strand:+ start:5461 stop:5697 length:237 start_codon:yes stop_codon:yes gene_type:complete
MVLRIAQLPDRTPVKLTLSVDPDLALALEDYAAIYADTYGAEEKPETLVPAMLEMFLAGDAGFKRARKALQAKASKGA